ncbi:hypothetical protein EDB85DRAFT_533594 [Lactarius pseudohatsudake]|nr:hypothetical protein EDB85DRAFT_533594 [Lactarius pseudohatsudake]
MTDYTTFPKGAHDSSSVFIDYAKIIGRAYESQAMRLIDICRSFSQVTPQYAHQDGDLRRVLRVCDIALRSAADSGTEVTDEANQRFKEATQVLSRYSERWQSHQVVRPSVDERMRLARLQDESLKYQQLVASNYWEPPGTTRIDFVLLRSPLSPERDSEAVTVRQAFMAVPRLADILWNFIRLESHARITLEQNPHFYSGLPTDESAYMPWFNFSPIKDFRSSGDIFEPSTFSLIGQVVYSLKLS